MRIILIFFWLPYKRGKIWVYFVKQRDLGSWLEKCFIISLPFYLCPILLLIWIFLITLRKHSTFTARFSDENSRGKSIASAMYLHLLTCHLWRKRTRISWCISSSPSLADTSSWELTLQSLWDSMWRWETISIYLSIPIPSPRQRDCSPSSLSEERSLCHSNLCFGERIMALSPINTVFNGWWIAKVNNS